VNSSSQAHAHTVADNLGKGYLSLLQIAGKQTGREKMESDEIRAEGNHSRIGISGKMIISSNGRCTDWW